MPPVVSIITASFNHEAYVGQAIESVLAQTFDDWEMIIVDDCSSDSTLDVITSFPDDRISTRQLQENTGGSGAWNAAMEQATGSIIMNLDSDDSYHPEKVARQVDFLAKNPEVGVLGTYINSTPDSPGADAWFNSSIDLNQPEPWLWSNHLAHSSVAITREAHERIGRSREDFKVATDLARWLRAVCTGVGIFVLPEVLTTIRMSSDSVTQSDPPRTAREYLTISQEIWHPYLERIGRSDLIVDNVRLALEHLVDLAGYEDRALASLVTDMIGTTAEGPRAVTDFVRRQASVLSDKDEALAAQTRLIDERDEALAAQTRLIDDRTQLIAEYENRINADKETYAWEIASRDSALDGVSAQLREAQERVAQESAQLREAQERVAQESAQLREAQERVAQLSLLEVSPKAQVRALRRALPRSARKRMRRIQRRRRVPESIIESSGPESDESHPGLVVIDRTPVSLERILRDVLGARFDEDRSAIDQALASGLRLIDVEPVRGSTQVIRVSAESAPIPAVLHADGSAIHGPLGELMTMHPADLWTFDIWDTLIERRRPPDAAKTATARRMVLMPRTLSGLHGMDTFAVAQVRCDVEAELARFNPSEEYELEDVLCRTLEHLGHPPGVRCRALAGKLTALEVADEIRWSRPRSGIVEFANAPDREVVLVSDFYMRGEHLERIVQEVAQIGREVVVSVDRGVSKRLGGELLTQVRVERDIAPQRHIHVGDNPYSDIDGQLVGGGIAIHVDQNSEFAGAGTFSASDLGQCWDALSAELDSLSKATDNVQRRAGQLLAPLAVCLSARGIEEAQRLGVDRVHYVSREGLFLSRVHQRIEPLLRVPGVTPVSGVHLEMSRRSTFAASLEEPFSVSLQRMWSMYSNQTVEAMLVSIGLDPHQCSEELQSVGLAADTLLVDASRDSRVAALLDSPRFAKRLRNAIAESQSLLRDYVLGETQVTRPFVMVDIGWRGTIQDNLVRAMGLRSALGVYLGLFPFLNDQPSGSRKLGIAFDGNVGDDFSFAEPPAALERPWTPDVPSTVGYRRSDNSVVPVHERESGSVSSGIAAFQEGTLEAAPIVADWLVGMGLTVDQLKPQLGAFARGVWTDPPAGLADIWFDSDHDDSFGALNVSWFGKDRPGSDWYQGPLRDHVRHGEQASRWPAGYRSWTPVRNILDVAAAWGTVHG